MEGLPAARLKHACDYYAAYETTANSLAFTLYMLARPENKSKVEKLTAEVDAFGCNRVPTFDDLDKFPWLEVSPPVEFVSSKFPAHLLPPHLI